MPDILGNGEIACRHAEDEQEEDDSLRLLQQFQGNVVVVLVVVVEDVFIDPVQNEQDNQEDQQQHRQVEDVVAVERPHVECHHHFEGHWKVRTRHQFMESTLTVSVGFLLAIEHFVLVVGEGTVTQVEDADPDGEAAEDEDSSEKGS